MANGTVGTVGTATGAVADGTPMAVVAPAVKVDNRSKRSDRDAMEGHFCVVVDGPHKGRYGTFEEVYERRADGYPVTVGFTSRDSRAEIMTVEYDHLRPSEAGHR